MHYRNKLSKAMNLSNVLLKELTEAIVQQQFIFHWNLH